MDVAAKNKDIVTVEPNGRVSLLIGGLTLKSISEDDCERGYEYMAEGEEKSYSWIAWVVAVVVVLCICSVICHCCRNKRRTKYDN